MDEKSDEKLEERDKVMEPCARYTSSSEDEDDTQETKVVFWDPRAGDLSKILDFTRPPNGINQSAALV